MSELTPKNSVPRLEPFEEAMTQKLVAARNRLAKEVESYRMKVEGARLIESDLFGEASCPPCFEDGAKLIEPLSGLCKQLVYQGDCLHAIIDELVRCNEAMDAELTALRAQLFTQREEVDHDAMTKAAYMANKMRTGA